jgi:hypothetical protein
MARRANVAERADRRGVARRPIVNTGALTPSGPGMLLCGVPGPDGPGTAGQTGTS